MEQETEYRRKIVREYRQALEPLLPYLPWLEKNSGKRASRSYQGQGVGRVSMSFPVYDANLVNFVKTASVSPLMERNYDYIYTRNRIRSHADERRLIAAAELKDWDMLRGILSKYVLGGRTKATLWSEAVEEGIFAQALKRMQDIVEYWDKTKKV